jgi:TetR/AcrR family transcriptional regulator, regulator of cefoperazone and chloramphenicol sensitivity
VLDEGFAAVSANHVAERAGVTWGVIQYHFGSSIGMFGAVVEAGFAELTAAMSEMSVPPGPTKDRVRTLVDTAWAAFSSPTSRASLEILIATRPSRDPETELQLTDMAKSLRHLGRHLCAPDGEVVGDLVWAFLRGLAIEQMVAEGALDSERQRSLLVDIVTGHIERTV